MIQSIQNGHPSPEHAPQTSFNREAQVTRNIRSYNQLAKMIVFKINEIEQDMNNQKLILVVDDEPLMFQMVQEFLDEDELNCRIVTARNGQKAYEMTISMMPNLIITDWLMAGVDGLDLIRKLKANPATREIPIIMTTGAMVKDEEIDNVLDAGALDYLQKPIDQTELRTRVKTAITLDESLKEIKQNKRSISVKSQFVDFLIDAAPNPIFYQDKWGRFIGCNENFEKLANTERSQIIGKTADQFLPPPFAAALELHFASLSERGTVRKFEVEIQDNVNGNKHLALSYAGFGNSTDEVIIGSVTDITEIIRSGQETLKQLQRMHQLEREEFANNVEKLQAELEFKHRELTMHLELLIHSRNVKEKLLEGVKKLQPFLTVEGKSKLFTLLRQLQWELDDETGLGVEKKFDELHAGLFATLEKDCPEITKNEKRLCAYLKMNHCASDIAKITDKSLNSVNVGFARLRTKLSLPSNKSLRTYLSELSPTNRSQE